MTDSIEIPLKNQRAENIPRPGLSQPLPEDAPARHDMVSCCRAVNASHARQIQPDFGELLIPPGLLYFCDPTGQTTAFGIK
jgi:hypothetical protein